MDRIYQTAHQLLTQRGGGWPLTMFINPEDQRPFFGGTYFPDKARHGMPAFADLLQQVARYYQENRAEIRTQGRQLLDVFARIEATSDNNDVQLSNRPLTAARDKLGESFDREYGGFGGAPKFPHPTSIERMLRHWRESAQASEPDVDALFMATLSLTRMAQGGIYDQLGGGFCRYSVDRFWQIPHFEKMLYDNGPLLALYAQAWLATGEPLFRRIASETAAWMLGDMQSPGGGFYSTRDADSEGEEGRYYAWTPAEVNALLTDEESALVSRHLGIDAKANFEGKWHLTVHETLESIAKETGTTVDDLESLLTDAQQKLLLARNRRVAPDRDEKQLTAWNALAIRGLAIAARSLQKPELATAAMQAADFILQEMVVDGRLLASHKDGRSRLPAYLDDHAFLLDAMLELLQTEWQPRYLDLAVLLADLLLEHFYDSEAGGFYFTADDAEALMYRPKSLADEALPSGNGIAVLALQRLGFLLGETRYLEAAEKTLKVAWQPMLEYAHGHVSLISALEEYLEHPEIIVIRGNQQDIDKWRDSAARLYAPRRMVFAIPADEQGLPGALADRVATDGETIAYRCVGSHCSLPITSWEALATEL